MTDTIHIKAYGRNKIDIERTAFRKALESAKWKRTADAVWTDICDHSIRVEWDFNCVDLNANIPTDIYNSFLYVDGHICYAVIMNGRSYRHQLIKAIAKASNFKFL